MRFRNKKSLKACMHSYSYMQLYVACFENLSLDFKINRKSLKTCTALVAAWANKKLGGWHDPDPR